jgi:hypothetical protein
MARKNNKQPNHHVSPEPGAVQTSTCSVQRGSRAPATTRTPQPAAQTPAMMARASIDGRDQRAKSRAATAATKPPAQKTLAILLGCERIARPQVAATPADGVAKKPRGCPGARGPAAACILIDPTPR